MCGKLGSDELESMQNMMSMAVYFVLADTFDVDIEELLPESDLQHDLGMTPTMQELLDTNIMDMFNNLHIDFSSAKTVQDILDQVSSVTVH